MTAAWNKFAQSLSTVVFPVLQWMLEHLAKIADLTRNIFNWDTAGIKGSLNEISKSFDTFFEATLLSKVSNWFKDMWGGDSLLNLAQPGVLGRINDYIENKPGYQYTGFLTGGATAPSVTNNIEISVPDGTTEEQAEYMSSRIQQAVDVSVMNVFQHIQNNNPVVE